MDNGASSYRRYLDGDKEAFDPIIAEYFDPLVFFLNRIVQDIAAAEDIAMDTFADLIVHKGRYNFKVSFKTYLYMLGRSRALNYIKRRGKIEFSPLDVLPEMAAPGLTPEQRLIDSEQRQALQKAMASLSPELREVLYLTYYEGLQCEEAAKVMKKNRKQVYNLLYRGKKELRNILGSEEIL